LEWGSANPSKHTPHHHSANASGASPLQRHLAALRFGPGSHLHNIQANIQPPAMASKVDRIVERLQEKIKDGDYYEAQQQTRVAASRYIKTRNWPAAIDILYNVAQSLLKAGQGGSAGDLCTMMVDVYKQAEMKPDAATKGRLLTCLRLFEAGEPTRKKFITELLGYVLVNTSDLS
jgi:hypothetical protein